MQGGVSRIRQAAVARCHTLPSHPQLCLVESLTTVTDENEQNINGKGDSHPHHNYVFEQCILWEKYGFTNHQLTANVDHAEKERDKPDDCLCLVDPGGQVHGRGGGRRPIVVRRTPKCWERRRRHPWRDSPVVSPWSFWHSQSQCRIPNFGLYPSSHVQSICRASQNKRSNFNDRRSSFLS